MNQDLQRNQRAGESGNTQDNIQLHQRLAALWVAVVALAVVLSGVLGYGFVTMHKHNLQLGQLPSVKETVALMGQRLEAAESNLRGWAADWERLEEQLAKLTRKVNYNRELARTEAQKLATQVQEQMQAELEEQTQALDARVTLLESGQQAERARLAQLQEEVAAVRRETGDDLASLHQQVARSERGLDQMARTLERQRVDFELSKNKTRELAPGVSLRLTGTSVSHQRAKGWLWLMPDRKTLWVRDLGIQQALVFYHKDGRGPNELVFTTVGKDAVAGYLLLHRPAGAGVTARAPAAGAGSAGGSTAGLSQ